MDELSSKSKLRVSITDTISPCKEPVDGSDGTGGTAASWILHVKGRLLKTDNKTLNEIDRKFSSFVKSVVIEWDNRSAEWHRTPTSQEIDAIQVNGTGNRNVHCTILLTLDYHPPHYKLAMCLSELLGVHTGTCVTIVSAFWQYIKTHNLQDVDELVFINCDAHLHAIFGCARLKITDIPHFLSQFLLPPDPLVMEHEILIESGSESTTSYEMDVDLAESQTGAVSSPARADNEAEQVAPNGNEIVVSPTSLIQ